jgi:hypothetical protein
MSSRALVRTWSYSSSVLVASTLVSAFIGDGVTVISNTSSWTIRRPPSGRAFAPPSGTR